MKNHKFIESIIISITIIILMGILTSVKIYPIKYFFLVFFILLWPLTTIVKSKIKNGKTFLFAWILWVFCSLILIVYNCITINKNNTWWSIYPIIGMIFWPVCETINYLWREKR